MTAKSTENNQAAEQRTNQGSRQQSWNRASTLDSEYLRWQKETGLDWRDMLDASK